MNRYVLTYVAFLTAHKSICHLFELSECLICPFSAIFAFVLEIVW
uniref:Uncharacterized protein n=1 Tax=Arundo donax TaxID=35708 RepID=A0A0A8ZEW2_ARUDO